MSALPKVQIHPATADRWADIVTLFGPRGACAGCWCMWARREAAEFRQGSGDGNKRALQRLVRADRKPGLLAYADGEPVGWVALAPRSEYPRLTNSRVLAPVDERPVWSVTCFFVRRDWRRRGLTGKMLEAAAKFAAANGAKIVEGYPIDARKKAADAFVWTGIATAFTGAGFREVARRSASRPIMRRVLRVAKAQRARRAAAKPNAAKRPGRS